MILRADDITFGYHRDQPVLRGVGLEVRPGQVTALFGPNGCGKSTLLRCMNGALRPQSGQATLNGRRVSDLSAREIAREVAVVPQDTPADVPYTAEQMVMLGRYARWDAWGQETPQDREIVHECLTRLGIAGLAGRLFPQLSGGERQRVILARALAQQGSVLLLDEPASHLDIAHQLDLYELVRELASQGQAILMVCHDILVSPMFVDAAVLLADGCVVAAGAAAQVLAPENLDRAFGRLIRVAWQDGHVHAEFVRRHP